MKKLITLILITSALLYSSCSVSSFSTVGNNGWKVTLYHSSPGVKIQEGGRDCQLVQAFAGHKKAGYALASTDRAGSGGTNLYTDGIQLDKSSDSHTITVSRGSKSVDVVFTHKSQPYLDVTASLGETKEMSLSSLQSEYLKEQTKKKK